MAEFINIFKDLSKKKLMRYITDTIIIFILGILFGLFSRIIDFVPLESLPKFLADIDLAAFFSRLSIWLLIALTISVVSSTPYRAMINVPVYFIGMLLSYYICTYAIEGKVYNYIIRFWVILTFISPILAYFCWYSKRHGVFSMVITAFIWSILFILAVNISSYGVKLKYNGLELCNFIISVFLLRNRLKQMIYSYILFIFITFLLIYVCDITFFLDKLYFV